MANEKEIRDSLDFVTKYYDEDSFTTSKGWRKLMGTTSSFWNLKKVAAASAIAVVVTASAFIYHDFCNKSDAVGETRESPVVLSDKDFSTRIEFKDATLKEVINEIEKIYNVKIENVPDTDVRITLSYEGTAEELVDVINDICTTKLTIKR